MYILIALGEFYLFPFQWLASCYNPKYEKKKYSSTFVIQIIYYANMFYCMVSSCWGQTTLFTAIWRERHKVLINIWKIALQILETRRKKLDYAFNFWTSMYINVTWVISNEYFLLNKYFLADVEMCLFALIPLFLHWKYTKALVLFSVFRTVDIFMSFHGMFTNRTFILTPCFRSSFLVCPCAGTWMRYWI